MYNYLQFLCFFTLNKCNHDVPLRCGSDTAKRFQKTYNSKQALTPPSSQKKVAFQSVTCHIWVPLRINEKIKLPQSICTKTE